MRALIACRDMHSSDSSVLRVRESLQETRETNLPVTCLIQQARKMLRRGIADVYE